MILLYPSPWERMSKEGRELAAEEQRVIVCSGAGERKSICAEASVFEFSVKAQPSFG